MVNCERLLLTLLKMVIITWRWFPFILNYIFVWAYCGQITANKVTWTANASQWNIVALGNISVHVGNGNFILFVSFFLELLPLLPRANKVSAGIEALGVMIYILKQCLNNTNNPVPQSTGFVLLVIFFIYYNQIVHFVMIF